MSTSTVIPSLIYNTRCMACVQRNIFSSNFAIKLIRNVHTTRFRYQEPKLNNHQNDLTNQETNSSETNISIRNDKAGIMDLPTVTFPEVVHHVSSQVGFWKREQGLQIRDSVLTGVGRVLRMFVSIERYDNWWESAMDMYDRLGAKRNAFDQIVYDNHGPEWAMGYLVFKMGGALKLVTDDRWVDNVKNLRVPSKKDCTIEAIDLRMSLLNYDGMKYFERLGYVRYLNVADSKHFDGYCMTRLHPIADTLEYLDVSGTSVTPESLTYLRIFPKLRWLNISRLSNSTNLKEILPFLLEILPANCVVISNDELPPESYGSEIPYRCPYDPDKDLMLEENPGIGDIVVFSQAYGNSALQVNDATAVHQLWKTPIISEERKFKRKLTKKDKLAVQTLVEYIAKAEQYGPLL